MELILVLAIIALLYTAYIVLIRPEEYKRRGRDTRRLSNMATLERMVNEFYVDNEYYPTLGADDLSMYNVKMPEDPVNDATYFFTYITDGMSYELNARLEFYTDKMLNDGGNQDDKYELGNDLDLLP